jgi:glutamate decarboxylase
MKGWQVPTYPLPENLENEIIHRYVLRADFSADMALEFAEDLTAAIHELDSGILAKAPAAASHKKYGFTH